MAKITRAHKVCDQQLHVLQERVAELEAKLAALDWTPITESNLPKVGDEVMRFRADKIRQTVYAVDGTEEQNTLIICLARGDTHFRPINPPPPSGAKGETKP